MRLSPHFKASELLSPAVPKHVLGNIVRLADLLEKVRAIAGLPIRVTSAYRTRRANESVGGSSSSDHLDGAAADIQVVSGDRAWQEETLALFDKLRRDLPLGSYGQIIREDRRQATGNPDNVCLHISLPTGLHPGTKDDASRLLVSYRPGKYERFVDEPPKYA